MKVLALDLSLTATGVVHAGHGTALWDTDYKGDQRLWWFKRKLDDLIENWSIDLAVVEDYVNSSYASSESGMLHGVIRIGLFGADIPVAYVPPKSLKKYATGNGNAAKPDMRMALYKRAGFDERNDNLVDATWLYYMALDHYGEPELEMPQSHRVALDKIAWPDLGADVTVSVLDNGETAK